jgi:hypothetical protein
MSNPPSSKEIELAEEVLSKLEPGFLPFSIFHQIARLTTTAIIEIVPLKLQNSKIEILLLERETDDPVWPSQLHIPGTVIRATDSLEEVFQRISDKELNGINISSAKFVTNILHHSGRGMEASQIYWIDIKENPTIGKFYDIDNLPQELVKSQLDFIPQAIEDYKAHNLK